VKAKNGVNPKESIGQAGHERKMVVENRKYQKYPGKHQRGRTKEPQTTYLNGGCK